MTVTPDLAREWLGKNKNNRRINPKRVTTLAQEIVRGNWVANGESIKLNGDQLLDGQHRLRAVVEADKPIETLVVSGLPTSVFATIDQNKKRSGSDALHVNGEQYSMHLAAAIRVVLDMRDVESKWKRSNRVIPNSEYIDFIVAEPGIRDSVRAVHNQMRFLVTTVSTTIPAALHYLLGEKYPTVRDEFFARLSDGVGLEDGDPEHTLRQKLIENASTRVKAERTMIMAWFVVAFNQRLQGKKGGRIFWNPDRQEFPVIGQ